MNCLKWTLPFLMITVSMAQVTTPVRWGVDDAGIANEVRTSPLLEEIFNEFKFNLYVTHLWPGSSWQATDTWCNDKGVDWIWNLEASNGSSGYVDKLGRDWLNRADGRHFWLFPDDVLAEMSKSARLVGIMYDEPAHMQNSNNFQLRKPFILDARGKNRADASDLFTASAEDIVRRHTPHGIKLFTEHVFPILYHNFARAGFTAGTKILKENWSPAYIAITMGAALQYGTELWITPDLWGESNWFSAEQYPAHSPEEYRSALLLAYHMGADCIYTENLSYNHKNLGYGSLVLTDSGKYTVTLHGKEALWFWKDYVPTHPRRYSFKEVRPEVAIIRKEDAYWGQTGSWLSDSLFGNSEWRPAAEHSEWLQVWNLLSKGEIHETGLSWHAPYYRGKKHKLFHPMQGVVVFDHLVKEQFLTGLKAIFLTGTGISQETQAAVEKRVKAGALCVTSKRLAPERIAKLVTTEGTVADSLGKWVITANFLSDAVRAAVQPIIPKENWIQYRFGDYLVTLRPKDNNPDNLTADFQSVGTMNSAQMSPPFTLMRRGSILYFNHNEPLQVQLFDLLGHELFAGKVNKTLNLKTVSLHKPSLNIFILKITGSSFVHREKIFYSDRFGAVSRTGEGLY